MRGLSSAEKKVKHKVKKVIMRKMVFFIRPSPWLS